MHVLDRPHLTHAAAITAVCAALAIVLTLILAGTLNDFRFTSPSGSPAGAPANVRPAPTPTAWNLTPFTTVLRSPVPVLWSGS